MDRISDIKYVAKKNMDKKFISQKNQIEKKKRGLSPFYCRKHSITESEEKTASYNMIDSEQFV